MRIGIISFVFVALFPTDCTGLPVRDLFSDTLRGTAEVGRPGVVTANDPYGLFNRSQHGSGFAGVQSQGTGQFVSQRAPLVTAGRTHAGGEGYTIILVYAPIETASPGTISTCSSGGSSTTDPAPTSTGLCSNGGSSNP